MTMVTTRPETRPVETVTPMKLSEAIRLGSLTTRPIKGFYFEVADGVFISRLGFGETPIGACAWGAAAFAMGLNPEDLNALYDDVGTERRIYLRDHITSWNDDPHNPLTREQIADRIEQMGY